MSVAYHGSPYLFDKFELSAAGEGTGIKFGFGVYLSEAEKTAVHYSQPRHVEVVADHYLYTVEIPELTPDNHLVSAKPVEQSIVDRVEAKLGMKVPTKVIGAGKDFRKWVGMALTGANNAGFEEEKRAAEFLDSVGVLFAVWPTAQTKPDGHKNIAVFNANNVKIIKREYIDVENVKGKWILINRRDI